jgi:hypothetical protein
VADDRSGRVGELVLRRRTYRAEVPDPGVVLQRVPWPAQLRLMCGPVATGALSLAGVLLVIAHLHRRRVAERTRKFAVMIQRFPPTQRNSSSEPHHRRSAATSDSWTVAAIARKIEQDRTVVRRHAIGAVRMREEPVTADLTVLVPETEVLHSPQRSTGRDDRHRHLSPADADDAEFRHRRRPRSDQR